MKFNDLPFLRAARGSLAFVALACIFKPAPVVGAPAPATRLAFPSGMMKFHLTSSGAGSLSGDMTWTWANGGQMFRQDLQGHLTGGARGRNMNTTSWTISDGKALYTALPSQMTGGKMAIKTALPPGYFTSMLQMGNQRAASTQSRVVGHAAILGKPCEIRLVNVSSSRGTTQSKVWIWKSLPLRTEVTTKRDVGGKSQVSKTTILATQVNTNLKPSPSLFRVPAGYKVQSMADFQKQMAGRFGR